MGRVLALLLALIAAAMIAWSSARPPEPRPASAPAVEFSAERAMADVRQIAREPHPMGTPANRRVRDHLLARMTALGLSPQLRQGDALNHLTVDGELYVSAGTVQNIVGVLPGRDRTLPAVALMAHYDSVANSPGAADDAAGVAAALEIVRAIRAQGQPARDVMVVITDGEESGLLGANAFFGRDPLSRRIGLLLNMESRGMSGRVQMFQTSARNGELIDLLRRTAKRPESSSLSVLVYEMMPNGTDLTESNKAGVPGLNYAFIGRQFDYHAATATAANLDRGTLQDLGDQVLSTSAAAAFAPALPGPEPSAVYSQVFGDLILAYPAWAGWGVLLAAAALALLGFVRARRSDAFPWLDVLRGAGAALSAALGAAAILHFARRATGAEFGFTEQRVLLAQVSRWETAVFLLALGFLLWSASELARGRRNIALVPLAAGLASSAFGGFDAVGLGLGVASAVVAALSYGRPVARPAAWSGVLALGFLGAVAAQVAAPAAAYLLAWPLLLAGLGASATAMAARRGVSAYVLLALLAAVGLGWLAGVTHLLFLGLDIPDLLAAPVLVAALLLWPLSHPEEGAPPARLVGPLLIAAGLATLIAVRLNTPWSERRPQATQVLYHQDQDTGRALRVSGLDRTAWVDRVLQGDGGAIAPHSHWLFRRPQDAAPARAIDFPPVVITTVPQADGAVLVTFVPPPDTRRLRLRLKPGPGVVLEQVGAASAGLTLPAGRWTRLSWEGAPTLTLRLRASGPAAIDIRYDALIDGWPAAAPPLPPRPATEMPFDISDSTLVTGTRRVTW
jgi:hypothetical protein